MSIDTDNQGGGGGGYGAAVAAAGGGGLISNYIYCGAVVCVLPTCVCVCLRYNKNTYAKYAWQSQRDSDEIVNLLDSIYRVYT